MESLLYFVLGLLSLTSLYFFLRCRTMAGAVRRTNRALKEISGELEANRVLKLPAPDREMEELLVTIVHRIYHNRRKCIIFHSS